MSKSLKMANHIYTVELRFYGDTLDPLEISKFLDLQPHNSSDHIKNIRKGRSEPFWAYNGYEKDKFQPEWISFEQGLNFLLTALLSKKDLIIELSKQYCGIWWCGHFQSSFNGGPTLSPQLLTELGSYGIPLSIDNYFSDGSENELDLD